MINKAISTIRINLYHVTNAIVYTMHAAAAGFTNQLEKDLCVVLAFHQDT